MKRFAQRCLIACVIAASIVILLLGVWVAIEPLLLVFAGLLGAILLSAAARAVQAGTVLSWFSTCDTTARASSWMRSRCSGPLKDSA